VFLLPSRQEKAGFSGLRLHSFDTVRQILRIESAVPEKMVTSIDAAGEFFNEQQVLFDVSGHLALMHLIITKERHAIN
jgi:hypothetical protein